MNNIIGPDVSFYQDDNATERMVDFAQMKVGGAAFVIIRSGQNLWADPDFKLNWQAAKRVLPRGSYWFYDSRVEPKRQADLWVSLFDGDYGELPLFADFEDNYGGAWNKWQDFYVFLERVRAIIPAIKEVGIYTAYYYWLENTMYADGATEYFKQFPLWVANYGVTSPLVPKPWTGWTFWQYTDKGDGSTYGVESKNIDLNYFNGDLAAFNKRFGLSGTLPSPIPTPEPIPTGENKMYDVISTIYNMTLRSDHNTGAVGSESVPKNTVMKANEIWTAPIDLWKTINGTQVKINSVGDKWAHIVSINGVTKNAWTAVVHNALKYCDVTVINEYEPDPTPAEKVKIVSLTVVSHYADGSSETEDFIPAL